MGKRKRAPQNAEKQISLTGLNRQLADSDLAAPGLAAKCKACGWAQGPARNGERSRHVAWVYRSVWESRQRAQTGSLERHQPLQP